MHQHALDRGAALARVLVRALHRQIRGLVQIGVVHHDQRVVAAEFEHDAPVARLGSDVLADGHAAGEGDQVHVGVGQHLVGDLARIARDDLQHGLGQACLVEQLGQVDCREGHLLRGLEHHAVVGGHARDHLVGDLVHRVVEWRDRGDHAQQRRALRVHPTLLAMVGQVAAENLPVVLEHFLRAKQQHIADPPGLVERIVDRKARLGGDQAGNVVDPLARQGRAAVEDAGALVAGQRRPIGMCPVVGLSNFFKGGLGHGPDALTAVRVEHLNVSLAPCANTLAHESHGIETVLFDKGCDVAHVGTDWWVLA